MDRREKILVLLKSYGLAAVFPFEINGQEITLDRLTDLLDDMVGDEVSEARQDSYSSGYDDGWDSGQAQGR